jgi:hypothetical protein
MVKAMALVECEAMGEGNMAFEWWAAPAAFGRVKDAPNRVVWTSKVLHSFQKGLVLRDVPRQGLASVSQNPSSLGSEMTTLMRRWSR